MNSVRNQTNPAPHQANIAARAFAQTQPAQAKTTRSHKSASTSSPEARSSQDADRVSREGSGEFGAFGHMGGGAMFSALATDEDSFGFEAFDAGGAPAVASLNATSANAILDRYQPTGMDPTHAARQGLSISGVAASQQLARRDQARLLEHKQAIIDVATQNGIPPAIFAAVISRESGAGLFLDANGEGDRGHAFGVGQVDERFHTQLGRPDPWSRAHLNQAAGILRTAINDVKAKHPSWSEDQVLRGGLVAYNAGLDNVQTIGGMDIGTTGNDYSNDVWARAQELAPSFEAGGISNPGNPGTGGTPSLSDIMATQGTSNERLLQEGAQGQPVTELQNLLGISADGVFGPQTKQAVINFQQANGILPAEGVVGATTLGFLLEANNQFVPAPSLDQIKTGHGTDNERRLRRGMEGDSIGQLQSMLGLTRTNRFDETTESAVKQFQEKHGLLPVSGVVGATTLETIEAVAPPPSDPSTVLRPGQEGPEVRAMQDKLVNLGYLTQAQVDTGPGLYGPRTENAVKAFQRAAGLSPSGVYDQATRRATDAVISGIGQNRESNADVTRAAQLRLVELGHMTQAQMDSGPGVFGPTTEAALKAFQSENNIAANGILGATTFKALMRGSLAVASFSANPNETFDYWANTYNPPVSMGFDGWRSSRNDYHNGLDLMGGNEPVNSAFGSGRVIDTTAWGAGYWDPGSRGNSNAVRVEYDLPGGNGTFYVDYGHMQNNGTLQVREGDVIEAGQPIGMTSFDDEVSRGGHLDVKIRIPDSLRSQFAAGDTRPWRDGRSFVDVQAFMRWYQQQL